MLLFCHPAGGQAVRHAAVALNEAGLLGEFWTCVHAQPLPLLRRMLPEKTARQLSPQRFPTQLAGRVRAAPLGEMSRLAAPRMGLRWLMRREQQGLAFADMQQGLDRRASQRLHCERFTGVYAYEGGAEALFRTARKRGLCRLYDLPNGYWRYAQDLLEEEAELAPEWVGAELPGLDSASFDARDDELAMADVAFVPSSFAMRTLDESRIFTGTAVALPHGAFLQVAAPAVRPPRASRTLRVLYIGSLGLRDGVRYLLAACRRFSGAVDLTFITPPPLDPTPAAEDALGRHRWIPSCPPDRMLDEMARHDVLVLPSLFEGFGRPLLDAMAAGLPVIGTENSAAPDLVHDGVQGYVVPIRDVDAIAEKLEHLHRNPALCADMGEAARVRARDFSWHAYRTSLAAFSALAMGAGSERYPHCG